MWVRNNRYKIKTKDGYKPFMGVAKKRVSELRKFVFDDDTEVVCSADHGFLTDYGFKKAKDITTDDCITGKFIKKIFKKIGSFDVYDPVEVEGHTYQHRGIISHNTEFIGSSSTLIAPSKLGNMSYVNPIRRKEEVDFYEEPKVGHNYFVTVDCARGLRMDYSVFVVIDVTNAPYKVVAKYRSNSVTPLIFPRFIYNLATYYNNAHVLVEANDVGQQVVEGLAYELGYENVLRTKSMGRAGWVLSGDASAAKLGVTTSASVKTKGCSNLKSLIETDRLIVEDYDIFVELTTFTRKSDSLTASFAAEPGTHDDLTMCMVLFSWAVMSDYWKELTNIDVAKAVYDEKANEAEEEEEDGLPLGFARINTFEDTIDQNGDVWYDSNEIPEWMIDQRYYTDF